MANDRLLDSLKPAEIKAAVLAEMNERGSAESYSILGSVAKRLDSREHNYGRTGRVNPYEERRVDDRYMSRVKRALETLTEEGTLVKHGSGYRNIPTYYTLDAWAAHQAAAREARDRAEEDTARWLSVAERLGGQEILMADPGHLSLSSWERLLDKAGW
jgi:hypothetical protein